MEKNNSCWQELGEIIKDAPNMKFSSKEEELEFWCRLSEEIGENWSE